jgi:hypothetical protein
LIIAENRFLEGFLHDLRDFGEGTAKSLWGAGVAPKSFSGGTIPHYTGGTEKRPAAGENFFSRCKPLKKWNFWQEFMTFFSVPDADLGHCDSLNVVGLAPPLHSALISQNGRSTSCYCDECAKCSLPRIALEQ